VGSNAARRGPRDHAATGDPARRFCAEAFSTGRVFTMGDPLHHGNKTGGDFLEEAVAIGIGSGRKTLRSTTRSLSKS